jgi:hypothetical protein
VGSDRSVLARMELAGAALGLAVALVALILAVDAIRFHAGVIAVRALEPSGAAPAITGAAPAEVVVLFALGSAGVWLLAIAARSLVGQVRDERAVLRRFEIVGIRRLDGRAVRIVRSRCPEAFCVGLLRPRVYVSDAALALLGRDELRAVLAHEACHAARRDPLRLLVARTLAGVFWFVPQVSVLGRRQEALAELAADAGAARQVGARSLAAALLAFDEVPEPPTGVAPERVDSLLGRLPTCDLPWALVLVTLAGLAGLAVMAVRLAVLPGHPELHLPPAFAPVCALATTAGLAVLGGPAALASRRVAVAFGPGRP